MESVDPTNKGEETIDRRPWWRLLNRYHWFVLIVAALGWLFDTMDQQLFNIARRPAIQKLLETSPEVPAEKESVTEYSGYATSIFLIGWGTGGLVFGIMGDLIGRVRSMIVTILLYSAFTGLSALSRDFGEFAFYRFLTGLGVGGEFAVGVSLVAEVMPDRARPFALALLQGLSAIGNITAALSSIVLAHLARAGITGESWRIMFVIGAVPATNLRGGTFDCHFPGRRRGRLQPTDLPISADHSAQHYRHVHLPRRGRSRRGRVRGRTHRATSQRRRGHALHGVPVQ